MTAPDCPDCRALNKGVPVARQSLRVLRREVVVQEYYYGWDDDLGAYVNNDPMPLTKQSTITLIKAVCPVCGRHVSVYAKGGTQDIIFLTDEEKMEGIL